MNKELEVAIKYLKHRGFDVNRPDTEYAALSSLSTKTIKRNKTEITKYFKQAPPPTAQEVSTIDNRLVEYLFNNTKLNSFRDVLGVLCGYLLVYRKTGVKGVSKHSQALQLGKSFLDILLRILSRKDYSSGVSIHSNSGALRYLKKLDKNHNFLHSYLTTDNTYYAGVFSKRYKLTKQSEVLVRQLKVILTKNLGKYVHLLGKHMVRTSQLLRYCSSVDSPRVGVNSRLPPRIPCQGSAAYKSPFICLPGKWTFSNNKGFLLLDASQLSKLSLPSLLHVMAIAILWLDNRTLIVPLKNLSSTNPDHGRHYNVFSRLRSAERKALGYINYDISGGIQIISFGVLFKYAGHLYQTEEDLMGVYQMIFDYGWNPEYKDELRQQLSKELKLNKSKVKALLTAYANGSNKNIGNNQLLAQFREESNRLRREVISAVEVNNPEIRKLAVLQSKHSFPDDFDWEDTAEDDDIAREKSSVYFFIWTYFEKQIRDAMLSVVDDGIPVHDAVYSKHKLPFKVFEDAILKQTGFEVKIGH